ncbi:MAG: DNA-3-methyladenine glycosylase I [Granulosicoccus sp.]
MSSTVIGADGKPRCRWCAATPDFLDYHDKEWGYPVDDDIRLFEKLCLESFQSGLSWRTILAKRENFRTAFHGFDFEKMATYKKKDIDRLMKNEGIIRHRGKIEAVINNAQCAIELVKEEGSLGAYFWSFEPTGNDQIEPQSASTSTESVALAKALKKKGWKFLGPTTVYAFLQAMGLINDHVEGCIIRSKVERARVKFKRPVRQS